MENTPRSVPKHLITLNPHLWVINPTINLSDLHKHTYIVTGSSFVDPQEPYGSLGNPFSVVIGDSIKTMPTKERQQIARYTNTPETVFINEVIPGTISLTVYTPSGVEMGACAHGFLGALKTLLLSGKITKNTTTTIKTTLNTATQVTIASDETIALGFRALKPQKLTITNAQLASIYNVDFGEFTNCGVLSVGSPKLTLEVNKQIFNAIQKNLKHIVYENLLNLQQTNNINGIHIFCRDKSTRLPQKCIQNNAFSGKQNLADRATGVSNAAQIAADSSVPNGQRLQVTQYGNDGPSAILDITKISSTSVLVGGIATLFNAQLL